MLLALLLGAQGGLHASSLALTETYQSPPGWSARDIRWADIDGDGRLDLVLASNEFYAAHPSLMVFRNLGGANFAPAWSSPYTDENQVEVSLGDYDADGDLDIVTAPYSNNYLRVYRNEGSFNFSLVFTGPYGYYRTVEWTDVDHDGDLDFATYALGQGSTLYVNTAGTFGASTVTALAGSEEVLRFADLDGDQLPDLMSSGSGKSMLWRNQGGHSFALTYTASFTAFTDGKWADMDADGDLDFVSVASLIRVFRNDGGFNFTVLVVGGQAGQFYEGVDIGDLDGDGLPEIVTASNTGPAQFEIYDNLGGLTFSLDWNFAAGDRPVKPALGDEDGDGDLDLALAQWDTYYGRPAFTVWRNDRIYFSPTVTPSFSASPTVTDTGTASPTSSRTPTPSATATATATWTETGTLTATPTFSASPSITPSFTQSRTHSITPTFSESRTHTPTRTATLTRTLTSTPTPTRTPTLWVCGGVQRDQAGTEYSFYGVAADNAGNAMAVGWGTVSQTGYLLQGIGPGATSDWHRIDDQAPGNFPDYANGVASDGNSYYVAGTSSGTGYDYASMRLNRYDVSGSLVWTRLWRDTQHSFGNAVAVRPGQVALVGNSFHDHGDIRTVAYDMDGNSLWARNWGAASIVASGLAVAYSPCGDLWVGGQSQNGGEINGVLLRYDADGNLMQEQVFAGSGAQIVRALAVDAGGNVHMSLDDNGGHRLVRLNSLGLIQQDFFTGMTSSRGIVADREGGSIIAGSVSGGLNVKRYKPDGSLHWDHMDWALRWATGIALLPDDSLLIATKQFSSDARILRLCQAPIPDAGLAPACPSATPSPSSTPTFSLSPSLTQTPSFSPSPSSSRTPSFTPTATLSPSLTLSPSATPSPSPLSSVTVSVTASPTPTRIPGEGLAWKPVLIYPHPVGAQGAHIAFDCAGPADLHVHIYNLLGELVWEQRHSCQAVGRQALRWDVRSSGGQAVSSGIYYVQIRDRGAVRSARMAVAR